jgi:hypothetical protein
LQGGVSSGTASLQFWQGRVLPLEDTCAKAQSKDGKVGLQLPYW